MRRREFITLLGGAAAAWPPTARAQRPQRMRRIGVLMGYVEGDADAQSNVAAFWEEFQKLGWRQDQNVRFEYRWATSNVELMQRYAPALPGSRQNPSQRGSTTPVKTMGMVLVCCTSAAVVGVPDDRMRSGASAQCDRVHEPRSEYGGQVGGAAQGDFAAHRKGRNSY
jgi:hypothetical protein